LLIFSLLFLKNSFWARGIPDCKPGANARFIETLGMFFESVNLQAKARDQNVVPDLESYIDIRRDTSGEFNFKRCSIISVTNTH
jgi:alpha-muurolene/germacrene-A/gamma-muurolene synthase